MDDAKTDEINLKTGVHMQNRRKALKTILITGAVGPTLLKGLPALAAPVASLKEAFKNDFRIGAALNKAQITGQDPRGEAVIASQFNAIAPEDCLKWENIHPEPERYDFDLADRYVEFGAKHKMFVVGHVLVWHYQTPAWVFRDAKGNLLNRDQLLVRMRDHIHTVVNRYKGRIHSWDVINEPIADDGTMRPSLWYQIIGDDYIEKAFHFAREADPKALLLYNDYSIEYEAKRKGADALITKLKAVGAPITSVGLQGHYALTEPSIEQLNDTITAFGRMGFNVPMTELDITVLPIPDHKLSADLMQAAVQDPALNPYAAGLPDSVQQQLARRYADLFRIFKNHCGIVDRVSFWGVTDGDSWKNTYPIRGRTDYPLLFDRTGRPKPAFSSVVQVAGS